MLLKSAGFNEVGNTYFIGDVAPSTHCCACSLRLLTSRGSVGYNIGGSDG